MADSKITALTSISTSTDPANDPLVIVDVSDTSMAATGTTKKVTLNQLLGASGTATLASATITGDLTVDTSTLKVDSTNNRVGIGTATPSGAELDVAGSIRSNSWLGRSNISVPSGDCSIFRSADNTLGFGIASTTAMTLNSTGLGVGVSPSFKLHVQENASNVIARFTGSNANGSVIDIINTGTGGGSYKIGSNFTIGGAGEFAIYDSTAGATRLLISSTGNVGVGVTPSAGKFEVQESGTGAGIGGIFTSTASGGGNPGVVFRTASTNRWSLSLTGSAGAESIRFYDINNSATRMTLDASGNLLVGTTTNTNVSRIFSRGTATSSALALQGASGDVALAQLTVGKFDNNTTTSQIFVRFTINDNSGGSGQINANGASQAAFGTFSDSRLKENIVSLPSQLANIISLRPVEFDYKDGSGHQIGFVAQEMQEVYSDAVGEQNGFLTVTGWSKTEARLVSAIKELAAKVQALEAKLA